MRGLGDGFRFGSVHSLILEMKLDSPFLSYLGIVLLRRVLD